jgi:hypothetical protein
MCFAANIEAATRKRMRSGDRPGLQNRRVAGFPVTGGFDSHSLPPFVLNELTVHRANLRVRARLPNCLAVIKT